MAFQVCVLGSGSRGNCTYVSSGQTSILIDAGLSAKATTQRLAEIGVDVADIRAVCLSHEHSDHVAGLRMLHRRHGIPVYANAGTAEGVRRDPKLAEVPWTIFATGSPFSVGDLVIEPFSVPHDAYEPVGFTVRSGDVQVGVATDMGVATTLIRQRLSRCSALVVEANHDEHMLQDARRPWHLKQRILGRQGHLSNEGAATILSDVASPDLRQVFLAHISDECNRHDLALRAARTRLAESGNDHVKVCLTFPDRVSEVWAG